MIEIRPTPPDHDTDDVLHDGRRIGFVGKKSGTVALMQCPKCDRPNYSMAVLSGVCCRCGWDLNKELKNGKD